MDKAWFFLHVPAALPGCERNAGTAILAKLFYGHLGIFIAYLLISFFIFRFVLRRPYLRAHRHWFYYNYAAFILLCGITHFLWVYTTFISPDYDLKANIVLVTAVVSLMAAGITPASLKYISSMMHDARGKETELRFEVQRLSERLSASDDRASAERLEIIAMLRESVEQGRVTMSKVDVAADAARTAADTLIKRTTQKLG